MKHVLDSLTLGFSPRSSRMTTTTTSDGFSVWNLTTLPTELTYHPTCLDLDLQSTYIGH